jgi:hypothetical protein
MHTHCRGRIHHNQRYTAATSGPQKGKKKGDQRKKKGKRVYKRKIIKSVGTSSKSK